ncbi:uncharacterized protein ColSpa_00471 [Colletotrichum spaethianum]|uniref:Uncharacterized protein n=1 Tax=Colletotrichum spaethianum TaxID=700344 RepID=A0AA37L4Y2_9PEZI|nr:uncharacterized protein ColSpa_00471 [Colletotrichum spaethianum]GKT40290.1 hypothetical protein ColSpa_00471 [Colletotrichum spaethianum]
MPAKAHVKLFNIQIEVLKKQGITPEKTKKLTYTNVVESKTKPVIQAARTEKGGLDITVSVSSTGADKKIFDDISQTTFGKNAHWVDNDYIKKASQLTGSTRPIPLRPPLIIKD